MILDVSRIGKSFQQGEVSIRALSDVSLQLEKARSLAVVGPSGSGKTTLLSLLAGLEPVDQGTIHVMGQNFSKLSEKQMTDFRARNIGIVFQQFYLMPHLTALENVCLPLEILRMDRAEERAETFLEQVGLKDRLHHLPNQLSGGECQRVAIARAAVTSPPLILADEPSGNLDTATGEKVMDILFDLVSKQSMGLVLVTHDSRLASRCHSQIHLVGGLLQ